jgi:hypothetical protein
MKKGPKIGTIEITTTAVIFVIMYGKIIIRMPGVLLQ